ncbi:putative protein TPRXL isoform X1 [Chenopodium quinoa]|uniref:putative protein TPRXL isoform X1 n=1 Tax=Chenopodium quinoa TaxID=63459 RepID=UPI000B78C657|nr:putative protein TPRXL isoform X1 [Chenopodium quinoa]XP_021737370.1 putative protein TPRXL isoform X1 [Chenopodium quinoa]XP_021737371.1 putative protein TPRXL isoform X1 [Chenopodium quinoa]XP_021737372.1 putative protein TPRXL isoform X1 [Chenopodium quinoa]XP_021737373.1 putative protein TPRXL isoform X1 [Chenopodium quinoa]XP_021737374.1 putative protein TPRXL isoform X1 [Chenopodium quinoa]XP_021737375.1 putative protein TPRXL isoform X1 [Chenopodium quinoa]XP_021737376.1 putative p
MSEDASQPTKKYATEQTSQVPTTIKWGPFSPPTGTTSKVVAPYVNTLKSAQQPPNENKVGPVWKNPPTGSSASSLKAPTTTSLSVSSLATSSCKAPEALPPKVPSSSNSPASSSHKVPNLPSGYEGKKSSTLSSVSSPNIPYSMASKPLKYPSNSSPNSDQPLKYPVTNSKPSTSSPNSNQPLKYPVTNSKPSTSSPNSEQPLKYPATNSNPSTSPNSYQPLKYPAANSNSHNLREKREEQHDVGHNEASEKGSKPLKSLRSKSHPDWPTFIDFDDKEEVMTIDANGHIVLLSGYIQPIDVWSNNGVRFYVEFNDLYQPIRKGGHILIRFLGSIAKMEIYCPLRELNWHALDNHFKKKIITE